MHNDILGAVTTRMTNEAPSISNLHDISILGTEKVSVVSNILEFSYKRDSSVSNALIYWLYISIRTKRLCEQFHASHVF